MARSVDRSADTPSSRSRGCPPLHRCEPSRRLRQSTDSVDRYVIGKVEQSRTPRGSCVLHDVRGACQPTTGCPSVAGGVPVRSACGPSSSDLRHTAAR
jgi:hypothetical protein